jgi:hypothetical protein
LPLSDPEQPLQPEVLRRLEEWGYRDQGDAFGELTLSDKVLEHLEEWEHQDRRPSPRPDLTGRS